MGYQKVLMASGMKSSSTLVGTTTVLLFGLLSVTTLMIWTLSLAKDALDTDLQSKKPLTAESDELLDESMVISLDEC